MSETYYADVRWTVEDVLSIRPTWTLEQAETFLVEHEDRIRDRLMELGWEVLETLAP